ncbi:MAG: hypothetical protein GY928_08215 [Colwellia sp.]|nr:hypothetical protein [Colwellia sp.]
MITASAEYLAKINSAIKTYYTKIEVTYNDAFLDPTITGSSTDNNYISYPSQMVNGRTVMTHKWAELDGQFILDGTFHLCPDLEASDYNEMGWWSGSIANGSGVIDATAQIDYTEGRKMSSFYVAFDDKLNAYGEDFTAKFYNGVTLVHTETVTSNTSVVVNSTFTQISDIDKVVLNVTKWSVPNTVVKVAEFTTQVKEIYVDDVVCGWSVTEERETSNDNFIPTGASAANQASFCLINGDGRPFDANNIASRLSGLVKPNARVQIYLGLKVSTGIEEHPMFTGWTTEWDVPEASKEVTATARDRLNLLTQTNITTNVIKNATFYTWMETVLNGAGLAATEYNIDSTLNGSDYIVPVGWFQGESHRRALDMLTQGSSSTSWVDRNGLIQIKKLENFDSGSVQTFTRSDYSNKDNQPIYQNVVNDITVITSPLKENTGVTVYETGSTEPENVSASSTETFTIRYNESPVSDITTLDVYPVVSGVTVTGSTQYSWGASVQVTNTNGTAQDFQLRAIGSTYEVSGAKTVNRTDTDSINENGRITFTYPTNRFLQKKNLGVDIADNNLASFKDAQRDLSLEFGHNGNPLIELGDEITVTDLYTSKVYKVISQDMQCDHRHFSMNRKGRV